MEEAVDILGKLLRDNKLYWALKGGTVPSEFLERLQVAGKNWIERFGSASPFTAELLWGEAVRNPHRVSALLQVLVAGVSPEMLVAAWRIIHGAAIHELHVSYKEELSFQLTMMLALREGDQQCLESYQSDLILDAVMLRHIGILAIEGRPIFDGFYPFKLVVPV